MLKDQRDLKELLHIKDIVIHFLMNFLLDSKVEKNIVIEQKNIDMNIQWVIQIVKLLVMDLYKV